MGCLLAYQQLKIILPLTLFSSLYGIILHANFILGIRFDKLLLECRDYSDGLLIIQFY